MGSDALAARQHEALLRSYRALPAAHPLKRFNVARDARISAGDVRMISNAEASALRTAMRSYRVRTALARLRGGARAVGDGFVRRTVRRSSRSRSRSPGREPSPEPPLDDAETAAGAAA